MKEFLSDLNFLEQIFFILAASSTLILVIQTIMALLGIGNDDCETSSDGGVDMDGDGIADGIGVDADMDADVGAGIDLDGDGIIDVYADAGSGAGSDAGDAGDTGDAGDAGDAGNVSPSHNHSSFDSHGLRLFTVRGIVAFFMVGCWSGLILSKMGVNVVLSCAGALVAGIVSLFFMAKIMQMLMGLQSDGTVRVRNALGQIGQVYIRIPASENGVGKVSVTVQEQLREFDAVTEKEEMIKTGEMVYITDVRAGNVLVVEKVNK